MALAKYTYTCAAVATGVLALYLCEKANFPTVVTLTNGEISTFTAPAGGFKAVEFRIDSASFESDTPEFDNTPMVTNKIAVTVEGPSALVNTWFTALVAAIPCGLMGIVTLGDSKSYLVGYSVAETTKRPLSKMSKSYKSGSKPGEDGMGVYNVTFSGTSSYDVLPFNTTINGTISGGTALFITF